MELILTKESMSLFTDYSIGKEVIKAIFLKNYTMLWNRLRAKYGSLTTNGPSLQRNISKQTLKVWTMHSWVKYAYFRSLFLLPYGSFLTNQTPFKYFGIMLDHMNHFWTQWRNSERLKLLHLCLRNE